MDDDPAEIADHLVLEHGLDAPLAIVDGGKYDANRNGDNYRLSIWREVGVLLRNWASD